MNLAATNATERRVEKSSWRFAVLTSRSAMISGVSSEVRSIVVAHPKATGRVIKTMIVCNGRKPAIEAIATHTNGKIISNA